MVRKDQIQESKSEKIENPRKIFILKKSKIPQRIHSNHTEKNPKTGQCLVGQCFAHDCSKILLNSRYNFSRNIFGSHCNNNVSVYIHLRICT